MSQSELYEIRLLPRNETGDLFSDGNSTIELDGQGNPQVITGIQALTQDVLKAVYTGPQADGYGTPARRIIGTKSIAVVKGLFTYTFIASFQRLVQIHNQLRALEPTRFPGSRALTSIDFIRIIETLSDKVRVQIEFRTGASELRNAEATVKQGG